MTAPRSSQLPGPAVLAIAVTPHGHLRLERLAAGADEPSAAISSRIEAAFTRGAAAGVLHLGAAEPATPLPASLAFFRDLGRLFVTSLSRMPDAEERREALEVSPPSDELAVRSAAAPPLAGLEYLTAEVLEALWRDLNAAAREELAGWRGNVDSWLRARSPLWHSVGRVCFHLAENRQSETKPFAFLATYASRIADSGRVAHQPLGHAVKESGATRDREALKSLLVPVQRASERSPFVKALVDSGEIFRSLAWTPRQAWEFLNEAPLLEESGVLLRLPDWWKRGAPTRPEVRVTVGGSLVAGVGAEALLDFSVDVALDGAPLTAAERRQILSASAGLALVRGQWVEIDPSGLREALEPLAKEAEARRHGVGIADALRLAAGLGEGDGDERGGWPGRRGPPGRRTSRSRPTRRSSASPRSRRPNGDSSSSTRRRRSRTPPQSRRTPSRRSRAAEGWP